MSADVGRNCWCWCWKGYLEGSYIGIGKVDWATYAGGCSSTSLIVGGGSVTGRAATRGGEIDFLGGVDRDHSDLEPDLDRLSLPYAGGGAWRARRASSRFRMRSHFCFLIRKMRMPAVTCYRVSIVLSGLVWSVLFGLSVWTYWQSGLRLPRRHQ